VRVARASIQGTIYDVYVVRRENITGSLQIRFMGRDRGKW